MLLPQGLGLTMEDVRLYFRSEFSKKMDIETYNKSGHDYMVNFSLFLAKQIHGELIASFFSNLSITC